MELVWRRRSSYDGATTIGDVLLACAKAQGAPIDLIRTLCPTDFGALARAAETHSLGSAVWLGVRHEADLLGVEVSRRLETTYRRSVMLHLGVLGTIMQIGPAFDSAGLNWAVVKLNVRHRGASVSDRTNGFINLITATAAIAITVKSMKHS